MDSRTKLTEIKQMAGVYWLLFPERPAQDSA